MRAPLIRSMRLLITGWAWGCGNANVQATGVMVNLAHYIALMRARRRVTSRTRSIGGTRSLLLSQAVALVILAFLAPASQAAQDGGAMGSDGPTQEELDERHDKLEEFYRERYSILLDDGLSISALKEIFNIKYYFIEDNISDNYEFIVFKGTGGNDMVFDRFTHFAINEDGDVYLFDSSHSGRSAKTYSSDNGKIDFEILVIDKSYFDNKSYYDTLIADSRSRKIGDFGVLFPFSIPPFPPSDPESFLEKKDEVFDFSKCERVFDSQILSGEKEFSPHEFIFDDREVVIISKYLLDINCRYILYQNDDYNNIVDVLDEFYNSVSDLRGSYNYYAYLPNYWSYFDINLASVMEAKLLFRNGEWIVRNKYAYTPPIV